MSEVEHVLQMLRATARRFGGKLPREELLRLSGRRRLSLPSVLELEKRLVGEGLLASALDVTVDGVDTMRRRTPSLADSRGWFLEAANEQQLLSPERELELFRSLRRADEAQQLLHAGELAPAEATRWLEEGRTAREMLLLANLRLVHWVAKPFLSATLDLQGDLLQQGYLGLHRATELFDPNFGTKFSTYATYWVYQSLTRYLDENGRTVRLPSHVLQDLRRLRKARARLHTTGQLDPWREASLLAAELGLDEARTMILLQLEPDARSLGTTVVDDGDGTELMDLVADDSEPEPSTSSEARELQSMVQRSLADFDARTQTVMTLRFGLRGEREHTLEEVGQLLGVTRERVRQLESKALDRLRHPSRSRRLEPFLDCEA